MQCLTSNNKGALLGAINEIMKAGQPDFTEIVKRERIAELRQSVGEQMLLHALFELIKNFCNKLNVARNMNEDQIIDAANTLLIDCNPNYHLEDFAAAFDLAARNRLWLNNGRGLIDRIDIGILSEIMVQYDLYRLDKTIELQEAEYLESEKAFLESSKMVPAEAWTELYNKMKADYSEGKTGFKPSIEEMEAAKAKRRKDNEAIFYPNQKNNNASI